ncbi:HipA N-terminal domain-containing protein [Sutterella wadsworthensis]|uniref:HipA N-terminal domain-containing protein n=1 Tax=Sutterella wadsworthensis TaxID=40545 RepID=UPI001D064792|nr:HipA N-terminal domain-containing protein [Sutterella wadsworthensis]MCB7456978.1 HipA N-terminal domain-containing protein [Sutterella wadsworthensis]
MMPSGSELQVLLGNVVVAHLSGDPSQPVLNWTSEWRQGGFPLAPSHPWEANGLPPSGAAVRNFFENMLPEGTAFDHLLEYAQISRSNSIGLALHLGNDLPGAI